MYCAFFSAVAVFPDYIHNRLTVQFCGVENLGGRFQVCFRAMLQVEV